MYHTSGAKRNGHNVMRRRSSNQEDIAIRIANNSFKILEAKTDISERRYRKILNLIREFNSSFSLVDKSRKSIRT